MRAGSTLHRSGAVTGSALTTAGVGKIHFANPAIFPSGATLTVGASGTSSASITLAMPVVTRGQHFLRLVATD